MFIGKGTRVVWVLLCTLSTIYRSCVCAAGRPASYIADAIRQETLLYPTELLVIGYAPSCAAAVAPGYVYIIHLFIY
jgi:hypothetical protein